MLLKTSKTKKLAVIICEAFMIIKKFLLKETVSRDFRPLVFFINQLPLGP
jgi:hypothetical protein